MSELEDIIGHIDACVDTYHGWKPAPENVVILLGLRRDLAVHLYRLAAFVKQIHGEAGLSYLVRKHAIAQYVSTAKSQDAKVAFNLLDNTAQTLPHVLEAQKKEIWAEAQKDAIKTKIDMAKGVLASMQQELSFWAYEHKNTSQQSIGK